METFDNFEEAYKAILTHKENGDQVAVTLTAADMETMEPVEQEGIDETLIWLQHHELYRRIAGAEHVAVSITVKKI